jgi:hypothetical protein
MPFACRALVLVSGWAVAAAAAPPEFVVEGVPVSSPLRAKLEAEAARAYASAQPWFDVRLERPVTIRWAADAGDLGPIARDNPGAVAGVAIPGEDRILLSAQALGARPQRIASVLEHEICHLLFARATTGAEVSPPRWLDEGIAMWRSGEWDLGLEWRARDSSLLEDAAAAGTLLRFRDLDSSFPSGPFFHVAYAQSHSFVEWLVRQDGDAELRRLVQVLGEDVDPEPAFRQVYGRSLADAEREWRGALGRGGWLRFLPSGGTLVTILWVGLGILVIGKFVRTRIRLRRTRDELGDGWE